MAQDTFQHLAAHYNSMMEHIDYERWVVVTTMIAELCPDEGFSHLDVACGTGALMRELADHRWATVGIDLSRAMLTEAVAGETPIDVAQADMCALPFDQSFSLATCFFDSLNFVTQDGGLAQALASMHSALKDDGVLIFDVITERMVLKHFADKDWIDKNNGHYAQWSGQYDPIDRIVTNSIRVNRGEKSVVQERVYPQEDLEEAITDAGFILLGVLDTETWCAPDNNSLRLDFVVTKNTDNIIHLKFESILADIQALLAD
jgi:SAM-dependent methyltransferase